jgi:molybdopterin converting factor small subunit
LAVKIKLNLPLQKLAGNRESVQTHGYSARQCLDDLIKQIPGSENLIFDENGSPILLFLLNNEPLPGQDLDRAVKDNDELWLLTIVSGG